MSFESMLHVLHGNKVIFIVIVIVIVIVKDISKYNSETICPDAKMHELIYKICDVA